MAAVKMGPVRCERSGHAEQNQKEVSMFFKGPVRCERSGHAEQPRQRDRAARGPVRCERSGHAERVRQIIWTHGPGRCERSGHAEHYLRIALNRIAQSPSYLNQKRATVVTRSSATHFLIESKIFSLIQ